MITTPQMKHHPIQALALDAQKENTVEENRLPHPHNFSNMINKVVSLEHDLEKEISRRIYSLLTASLLGSLEA